MRTTRIDGFTFVHNGDFSGKVSLQLPHADVHNWPDYAVIEIPFLVLAELVGRALRDETLADIMQESGLDFLGIHDHDDEDEDDDVEDP